MDLQTRINVCFSSHKKTSLQRTEQISKLVKKSQQTVCVTLTGHEGNTAETSKIDLLGPSFRPHTPCFSKFDCISELLAKQPHISIEINDIS